MKILLYTVTLGILVVLADPTRGRKLPHRTSPMTLGSPEAPPIIYQHVNRRLQEELKKQALGAAEQCYEIELKSQTHADDEVKAEPPPLRGLAKTLKMVADMSSKGKIINKHLALTLQRIMHRQDAKQRKHLLHGRKMFTCPNAEDISPCLCDSTTITINCTATGNFTLVKNIFRTVNFPEKSFVTFLMRGMGPGDGDESVLWNNTFGPVSFQEVLIENTELLQVQENAFAGSELTLRVIQMQHNTRLEFFPFQQLFQFTQLTDLMLGYGSIHDLPILQNIPTLEIVYLDFNQIQQVFPRTFAELPRLSVLDLGFNKLESIAADDLQFSSNDAFVYLDENLLTFLDDYAFSGALPSLLDVSNNLLTSLNMAVFKPILDHIIDSGYNTCVDVTENPLCCGDIQWVLNDPTYSDHIGLPEINCTVLTHHRKQLGA